jgi:fructosamine-3-kinase
MKQNAFDLKLLDQADLQAFERMAKALPEIIPNEKPALLHGDLWSGNKMPVGNGMAAVFDPAVYFGHREVDIAMTRLFGGFCAAFYDAYSESFSLEPGWESRMAIHNLYPLLVHLILFGRSYYSDIASTLKQF